MKAYNDYFGDFGGRYAAEVLRTPLDQLQVAFTEAIVDKNFVDALDRIGRQFAGRPTPLSPAVNAQTEIGGARIYLKLEGLANTGAHKVNNVIGQCLLAKRMGKKRVIAETGAGQHGVATAAVAAKLGLECCVYMGEVDVRRQRPNVFWMELFGAEVVPVSSGSRTLKDAINEALRDWSDTFDQTHYVIGSVLGPSPFPDMVREFQSVVGREVVDQCRQLGVEPTALIACVGGGSNALGFFAPHIEASEPRLIGVEAGGRGPNLGDHAARMTGSGMPSIVHGYKSLFLTTKDGQVANTHSISAGLDYPGVGPQLAHLGTIGRVEFTTARDDEALAAVQLFARREGIIFALESAHAGAAAIKIARSLQRDSSVVVNVSGRGDKDLFILAGALQPERWTEFLKNEVDEISNG